MNKKFDLTPPSKVTVVDAIIEQLVTKIRDGELEPGERLPSERQLTEMLQVSRSSVREALQGLGAMGLVETKSGAGTFVKDQGHDLALYGNSIESLSDFLQKEMRCHMNQARLFVEQGTVTKAAENITEESSQLIYDSWKKLYEAENQAIEDPDKMDWTIHDNFHLAIAKASGNPFLVELLITLLDNIPLSLRDKSLIYGGVENKRRILRGNQIIHQNLCQAIIQGDAVHARKWFERHSDYESMNIDRYFEGENTGQVTEFEQLLMDLEQKHNRR